jgi:hypothetical protein
METFFITLAVVAFSFAIEHLTDPGRRSGFT